MKQYAVNEIFWSPQVEGMRAGQMSVFIRLTGCNLKCRVEPGPDSPGGFDCDTEFASGRKMTSQEIVEAAYTAVGKPAQWFMDRLDGQEPWVVLTGGEPALQVDRDLVIALHDAGFHCAIETNGSKDVSGLGLDWITVSPKVAEHAVRQLTADEVKYVRGYGQAIPRPTCKATHQLISPAFHGWSLDPKAVQWCLQLIKENPEWRLSMQQHKAWNVR
jgi:organic radical activating enzyme